MMTRSKYTLIALVALLAGGATDVVAQRGSLFQARRAWLGFSYDPTTIRVDGGRRPALVVVEVMEDSPAEAAGLLVGDTIWAINDLRVTDAFMESLGSTLESGDAVRIHVRSRNRDRTLSMNAASRPPGVNLLERRQYADFGPDDVRERVRILLDSARVSLDTTMIMPRLRFEQLPGGGSVYMFGDSALRLRRFDLDSTWITGRGGNGVWLFTPDTLRFHGDSLFFRALPRIQLRDGRGVIRIDSLMRSRMDTISGALRAMPRGRIYGFGGGDSIWTFASGDRAFSGFSMFGARALGGAELTEINPDLGEYFGTEQGVLVVRVPSGTPAERAGLAAGDVITGVNGRTVESVLELSRAVAERERGSIRLEILRKKQRRTIELRDD